MEHKTKTSDRSIKGCSETPTYSKSGSTEPQDYPTNKEKVQQLLKENEVVIFGKRFCPYCTEAQMILENDDIQFHLVFLDKENEGHLMQEELEKISKSSTVPYVFIKGRYAGGLVELLEHVTTGTLKDVLNGRSVSELEFDLIVIGGGSAGIAAAKEAAKLGKSVALINYSKPTQHGNRWVLGGRAVNIGELPRKLMYRASLFNDDYKDAPIYGWAGPDETENTEGAENNEPKTKHSWNTLVTAIRRYIDGISWRLKKELREVGVKLYDNWRSEFVDHHTLTLHSDCGKQESITGRVFIIATGTKAVTLDVIGAEETITPDELFFVEGTPERVLIVGNGNDALELAAALSGLGSETTILVKKRPLGSGLDEDISKKIRTVMAARGVRFLEEDLTLKKITPVENTDGGVKRVEGIISKDDSPDDKNRPEEKNEENIKSAEKEDEDTGDKLEVELGKDGKKKEEEEEGETPKNKDDGKEQEKVEKEGNKEEKKEAVQDDRKAKTVDPSQTSFKDASKETEDFSEEFDLRSEVATQVCEKPGSPECAPSRVLTPVEYAFLGVTEEAAKKLYGEIQTFHNIFSTEDSGLSNRFDCRSYVKVICTKVPAIGHQVVGLHLLCPNASEMIQGFVIGYQNGNLTKEDLDCMIAVHPIAAQIFTNLTVMKESGEDIGLQPF